MDKTRDETEEKPPTPHPIESPKPSASVSEHTPPPKPAPPVIESAQVAGLRHVNRALAALRGGSDTTLHLNAKEQAAVVEHLKDHAIENEVVRGLVERLMAGHSVQAPARGTIPNSAKIA